MLDESHFKVNQLPLYPLGDIAQRVVELRMQGREIYDFGQLNPNLGPPAAAVEAMVAASLKPHNHRYSSSSGIKRLREELSSWYDRNYGVQLDATNDVVLTLGTKQGLSHLLFAILRAGDSVLVPSPSYPIHGASVVLAGGNLINFSLFSDEEITNGLPTALSESSEGFFSRLEFAIQHSFPRPTTLILSFPHNPTGLIVDQSFLDRVVSFARKEGIIILHDFAYSGLVYDGGTSPSILSVPGASECCVEFTTLSKTVNLPGWRIGFAAGNPKLIGALKRIKGYLDYGAFQPLQIAAIQVLTGFEHIVRDNLGVYAERRTALIDGLKLAGFEFERPRGGLFIFPRLGEKFGGESGDTIAERLMEEVGVVTTPGSGFDPAFKNYLRLVFSETETRTREAIDKVQEYLK